MELASMLAGETFTDHPESVSRTLAAFLRTYNDIVDDERRQDLYAYAAMAVGTTAGEELEKARARHLIQWSDGRWERRARWSPLARLQRRAGRKRLSDDCESAARYAIRSLGKLSDETHVAVLRLVDELITVGAGDVRQAEPSPQYAVARLHAAGRPVRR
jgi:hypothetical protein